MKRLQRSGAAALLVAALLLVPLTPVTSGETPPHAASERQFVSLMNASRTAMGRSPLHTSPDVATVARAWARRMASDGDLRHNPHVAEQVPVQWRRWGENVGWASNGAHDARSSVVSRMHRAFMDSDGHRANILGPYNQVGVGVAVDGDGTMWATMVFVDGCTADRFCPSARVSRAPLASFVTRALDS